jgi:hypothetical protein
MSGLKAKEPQAFLKAAWVKPKVYLLGCNNRQITFYSQQTRAVNLIYSLLQTNELQEGQSVAVVGAGVSGLTAAGFAAMNGCKVGLYERENEPLTLQRACENRWVHPHIYDWPEPGSLNDDTGDLPILNWKAGSAKQVIEQIQKGWRALSQEHSSRIAFYPRSLVGSDDSQQASLLLSELTEKHDVVILAIGFGQEPERFGTKSYWVDDDIQNQQAEQWLISGFGDGALADLMQICVPNFKHEELKDLVAPVLLDGPMAKTLLANENEGWKNQEKLNRYYERDLRVPAVLKLLRDRVDVTRRIFIQGKAGSYLYGSTSAIINRFVTSQIQRLYEEAHGDNAKNFFRVVHEEWVGTPNKKSGATFQVAFNNHSSFEGALVVRHGPEPVLKACFPDLWELTESVRETLRDLPQQLDPSRLPILQQGSLWEVKRRAWQAREWWCLVLTAPEGNTAVFKKLMKWTLAKLREPLQKWFPPVFGAGAAQPDEALKRAIQPTLLSVAEALRDAATYRATVWALCRANLVIADVTEFDPAMMVLLGIRAAVRRGVTIVSSARRPALHDYDKKIPFNLRELSILDHSGSATDEKAEVFANVIRRGMENYLRSTNYEDLPGYAYVRLPKVDWPKNDVLVLCPFLATYEDTFKDLEGQLRYIAHQQINCRRVIDDPSPRLNSQRLFGAIRHADDCLIDWTEWRHNVFFELGVRLAVHPKGAISILKSEDAAGPQPPVDEQTKQRLKALFQPLPYEELAEAWQRYQAGSKDSLGGGETYRIVSEAVELESPFFTPVHNLLLSSVTNTIRNTPGAPDIDELYARANDNIPLQYQQAARERLLAAWYYLENRFQPAEFTEADLKQEKKAEIAVEYTKIIKELLKYLKVKEFKDFRIEVKNKQAALLKRMGGLRALTDVLETVKDRREDAKEARDAAILDHDLEALADARLFLQEAIDLLKQFIPAREAEPSDTEKTYAQRLYQCLGSLGGTWRDAAELESDLEKKRLYWDKSIACYDEGYRIESGTHEGYPDFGFADSYNLLQRLVVRILREPRCLTDGNEELGKGLNVPEELARVELKIKDQLAEPDGFSQRGSRKGDAWAMADLAEVLIFRGQSCATAWREFAKHNRSSEAYGTNYRAFTALINAAAQSKLPPLWLPAAKETVLWLAERLKTLYDIEV